MKLHPVMSAVLWPLSLPYRAAVALRTWLYRKNILEPDRLTGVVISVGNLTVGGTGKTPFVLWLAEQLFQQGRAVGILTRGYNSRVRFRSDEYSPTIPPIAGQLPGLVYGDEPHLLAAHLTDKVLIGVNPYRFLSGRMLQQRGVDTFILDDGFQHFSLARDVDIVLLDKTARIAEQRLLPAGPRREPLSALSRADMVVITRTESDSLLERTVRQFTNAPIFYARTFLQAVRLLGTTESMSSPEWLGKRVFTFCAIGNPEAFADDVRCWGFSVVGGLSFRDHHRYSNLNVRKIERLAIESGADALICTEKDTYNLGNHKFEKLPCYVCEVTMRPMDESGFLSKLNAVLESKKQPGAGS